MLRGFLSTLVSDVGDGSFDWISTLSGWCCDVYRRSTSWRDTSLTALSTIEVVHVHVLSVLHFRELWHAHVHVELHVTTWLVTYPGQLSILFFSDSQTMMVDLAIDGPGSAGIQGQPLGHGSISDISIYHFIVSLSSVLETTSIKVW